MLPYRWRQSREGADGDWSGRARAKREEDEGGGEKKKKDGPKIGGVCCWSRTAVRFSLVFVNIYIMKKTLTPPYDFPAPQNGTIPERVACRCRGVCLTIQTVVMLVMCDDRPCGLFFFFLSQGLDSLCTFHNPAMQTHSKGT